MQGKQILIKRVCPSQGDDLAPNICQTITQINVGLSLIKHNRIMFTTNAVRSRRFEKYTNGRNNMLFSEFMDCVIYRDWKVRLQMFVLEQYLLLYIVMLWLSGSFENHARQTNLD